MGYRTASLGNPGSAPSYTPARMDRRSVLKALGMLASAAALEGCAAKHVTLAATPPPVPAAGSALLKLPKVNVQPDREIRTVVGLRPFRPSGFVVGGQKLDDKLVVHNYGHGGGGVTLSWGTGELACREVDSTGEKNIAVLGCGAVGLATARLLQERGCTVTIYAKDFRPRPPPTSLAHSGFRSSFSSEAMSRPTSCRA